MNSNSVPPLAKSGIRKLAPGEILFNEGELADSLYIIQKGQVRLYKPKGKGFIELGVLRLGEVIGEMAYFDDDGSGRKRSCSAEAITPVEIIEISFIAFGKTMQSLNPWFKTIINTLVTRLRKTNMKVKELEDNQTSVNYSSKQSSYEFIRSIEVMRILGTIFLVFKAHGEHKQQSYAVSRKTLSLYTQDMYRIAEVKLETIINLLVDLGWMEVGEDEDKLPNLLILKDIDVVRQIFIYYTGERYLPENKRMKIGDKCELLIIRMIEHASLIPLIDIKNPQVVEDHAPKFTKYYNISPFLAELRLSQISAIADVVEDGKNIGLFGDVVMVDDQMMVETDFPKLRKLYPVIRFMNLIRELNGEKNVEDSYIPAGR
jgi:CRP/FNR family cyclic AMP-dependent transcriptional regulator